MNIRQIDGINRSIRQNRNDPFYDAKAPNWRGCFVGSLKEWKNFQAENRKVTEWCTKHDLILKNGENWDWVPEGKEAPRGARYTRMIVPRRIDYEYFICDVLVASAYYCTEIEWYGEPEKFEFF